MQDRKVVASEDSLCFPSHTEDASAVILRRVVSAEECIDPSSEVTALARELPFLRMTRDLWSQPRPFLCHPCIAANKKGGFRRPWESAGEGARATQSRTYVPSLQPARYPSCSGVSLSILMPMDSNFNFATLLSRSSGTL